MPNSNDFKKKLSDLRGQLRVIKGKMSPDIEMSDDDETEMDKLMKEIEDCKRKLALYESAEEEERKAIKESEDYADDDEDEEKDAADIADDVDSGIGNATGKKKSMAKQPHPAVVKSFNKRLGAPNIVKNINAKVPPKAAEVFMMADAITKLSGSSAFTKEYISKAFGSEYEIVTKTLTAQGQPNLIEQDFIPNFLEGLWSRAIVRASGANVINTPGGNGIVAGLAQTSGSFWVGEAQQPVESEAQFNNARFGVRKLGAVSMVSNDWLRRPELAMQAANRITDTMARDMVLKEDFGFLLGAGTAATGQPLGIINTPNVQLFTSNVNVATNGTTLYAQIQNALIGAETQLIEQNADYDSLVWYLSPGTVGFLRQVVQQLGIAPFDAQLSRGELLGHKVYVSNQIPTNLTTIPGSSSSYAVLLDPTKAVWIADTLSMQFYTSLDGTVMVNGVMQSARATDSTLFTAWHETDLQVPYPQAVAVGTVNWTLGTLNGGTEVTYPANIFASNATVAS
jgi:HK97 family phage major capsid protein